MTESITQKDLEGLRRVASPAYLATIEDTRVALRAAFNQAAQAWGVGQDVSVILRLASELDDALPLAAENDESARKLAGARMELGRVKKQRDELRGEIVKWKAGRDSIIADRTSAEVALADALKERDELKAALVSERKAFDEYEEAMQYE